MKQKKAILMPEVLKLIIGVVCLVLLLYLAVNLYGIFNNKSDLEKAGATLDNILGKMNQLKNNGDKNDYLVTGPAKWGIYSYLSTETKPQSCGTDSCLCMCKGLGTKENILDACDNQGVCKKVEKEIVITDLIPNYLIPGIYLENTVITLYLMNNNGKIRISANSNVEAQELFYSLAEHKYNFLDQGEKTIGEQIIFWYNSGATSAFRSNEAKVEIEKNIANHFSTYPYKVSAYVLKEEQFSGLDIDAYALIKVQAGGNEDLPNERANSLPTLSIKNTEGKRNLLIYFRGE